MNSEAAPSDWKVSTVGETAEILDSKRIPLNSEERRVRSGPYPYWGANGIVDYIDSFIFNEPLVLMAEDGGYFDQASTRPICQRLDGPAWVNNHAHIIRPTQADRDYFYYWFVHRDITPFIKGGTRSKLNQADLKGLPIWLPPFDEQQRIVEVLRSVDESISAHQAVASTLTRSVKTMRHELLCVSSEGTVDELPQGWTIKSLEELATVERGKFSVRPRNDPRYFGGSTPFIQTGDITSSGDYILHHSQTLNDMGVGVSRVFAAGTIMTTIAANIGDFSIASYPMACPDSVVGIVPNDGIDTFWLYATLSCFKRALDRAATQNAQKNINLQTLRPLIVPVPPRELMLELSETLSMAGKASEEAEKGLRNLHSLKSALMADLLSGRVRVPI